MPLRRFHRVLVIVALLLSVNGIVGQKKRRGKSSRNAFSLKDIRLPTGFRIENYASGNVPNARSIALSTCTESNATILYISTRRDHRIFAVIDDDSDGVADRVNTVLKRLFVPNGIAYRNGSLYVATVTDVLRYDDVDRLALSGKKFGKPTVLRDDFPLTPHHYWKYIGFSPDGKLFIAVGLACNLCEPKEYGKVIDGTIMTMNPDGRNLKLFVSGLRNSVGFDWHPFTKEFFFTENGADYMGNDFPDDVLHVAVDRGQNYSFPYCHVKGMGDPHHRDVGTFKTIKDQLYGDGCTAKRRRQRTPVQALGPHVAALGMRFYTGKMFPPKYRNSIFIAEHGSWNRDDKIGYRVVNVKLGEDNRTAIDHEIFATGWMKDDESFGRPVDVQELPDGSLLISDDQADSIYRIVYEEEPQALRTAIDS